MHYVRGAQRRAMGRSKGSVKKVKWGKCDYGWGKWDKSDEGARVLI
jgi:hypothetical protein